MSEPTLLWTQTDEAMLQNLIMKKRDAHAATLQKVEAMLEDFYYQSMPQSELAKCLAEKARTLSEILRPFCEGKIMLGKEDMP